MGRILACAVGVVLVGVAAAGPDLYPAAKDPKFLPAWFKSAKGQFPSDGERYYTYSPPGMLMNFFEASVYCSLLGFDTKLWCPNSLKESQLVFTNVMYEDMADLIDGKIEAEDMADFMALGRTDTFIGIKQQKPGFTAQTPGSEFHNFYACKNSLMDTKWKFESWSGAKDAKNPWDTNQPPKATTTNKDENCVVIGQTFSTKWNMAPCKPNFEDLMSMSRIKARMRTASRAQLDGGFLGARAICMSRDPLVNMLFKPKKLDEAVMKKVITRFKALRDRIINLIMALLFFTVFIMTGGFFCFYCCYCCCCCGAPCKGKNDSGVQQNVAPPAAVAVPPTDQNQYAPPPPQPPMQAPAPQGYYPPPSPQPMMMQPMMQPMTQPPMGGMNINIANTNNNS